MSSRRTLFLALLCTTLFALPLAAELAWTPADGVPVRAGQGLQDDALSATHEDGYTLTVWIDSRDGDPEIHGQSLDEDAVPTWPDEGVRLVTAPGSQQLGDLIAVDDGFILTWLDSRNQPGKVGSGDLYIQKYNMAGETVWQDGDNPPSSGILVYEIDEFAAAWPVLVADDNGGVFLLFGTGDRLRGHRPTRCPTPAAHPQRWNP